MPSLSEMLAKKASELYSELPCGHQEREMSKGSETLYQPLDEACQTIRLLRIHPPSHKTPFIECTLYTARLDGNPQFTALSYVWGDPDVTETVIVNGISLQVTVNLATALRHLQATNVRLILDAFWADGICIDQSNLKERAHQVALMGRLYRQARLVCSWVGLDEDGCCKVMEACHQAGCLLDSEPQDAFRAIPDRLQTTHASWNEAEGSVISRNADMDLATHRFAHRPLFWRAWVFQEAVLAASSLFICDYVAIDGDNLYRSVSEFSGPNHSGWGGPQSVPVTTLMSLRDMATDLHNITDIYQCRKLPRGPGSRGLYFYLKSTIYLKVSNPIDKVFAVLGLAQSNLHVSYKDSITTTYFAAAKHMILAEGSFECLLMAGTDNPPGIEPTEPEIPSWVPDHYAFTQASTRHLYFRQKLSLPVSNTNHPTISESDMTLTCDAIPLMPGKPYCSMSVKELLEAPKKLKDYVEQLVARTPSHPSGVPHLRAFFHFLLSLDESRRYEKLTATFMDQQTLLIHSGLKLYTTIVSKWPSEHTLPDVSPSTDLLEEFLESFLGSRDFILHPDWSQLRMTLRFDYDDTLTSILVHALQAIAEETVFSTDSGHLGICAFPLSPAGQVFHRSGLPFGFGAAEDV